VSRRGYRDGVNSWALARARETVESLHGARLDPDLLRLELARTLRPAVPFDGWCITTVDPDALLVSSVVADNPAMRDVARLMQIEYASDDVNLHRDLMRRGARVGVLSRSTGGDLHRSMRWRDIYQPGGIGDELRVELAVDGRCWGTMEVVRERHGRLFSDDEADFALRVAPRVAILLRQAQARAWSAAGSGDGEPDPRPGVLVLDASLSVAATTADAERWLTELSDAGPRAGSVLPAPILAAAASTGCGSATSSRVRTPTKAGRWVTISAARLTGPNQVGHTAVTLQRSGLEATDLVLEAHGLTPRERQLAGQVLHGLSNDEIARRLFLSRYTVGDHVKAILAKVGARSKQEFIAATLGGPNRTPVSSARKPAESLRSRRQRGRERTDARRAQDGH
jgi:DNA-binding CsgD family transcriptional regulator